jgi:hypothetical protein
MRPIYSGKSGVAHAVTLHNQMLSRNTYAAQDIVIYGRWFAGISRYVGIARHQQ